MNSGPSRFSSRLESVAISCAVNSEIRHSVSLKGLVVAGFALC